MLHSRAMSVIRRCAGRVAGVLLILQLCVFAGILTGLSVHLAAAAAECTCAHGADAMCPMHRHSPASGGTQATCAIGSVVTPHADALGAMLGPVALLPAGVSIYRA